MTGYPKIIYWIQGLLLYIAILNCWMVFSFIVILSGFVGPLAYQAYWESRPSTKELREREAKKNACSEEKSEQYRATYKEAMPAEEEAEINETIRLVNE